MALGQFNNSKNVTVVTIYRIDLVAPLFTFTQELAISRQALNGLQGRLKSTELMSSVPPPDQTPLSIYNIAFVLARLSHHQHPN